MYLLLGVVVPLRDVSNLSASLGVSPFKWLDFLVYFYRCLLYFLAEAFIL